jgi:hypothetical protein
MPEGKGEKHMTKIVLNKKFGGFELSEKGFEMFCRLKGAKTAEEKAAYEDVKIGQWTRHDRDLVKVVKNPRQESKWRTQPLEGVRHSPKGKQLPRRKLRRCRKCYGSRGLRSCGGGSMNFYNRAPEKTGFAHPLMADLAKTLKDFGYTPRKSNTELSGFLPDNVDMFSIEDRWHNAINFSMGRFGANVEFFEESHGILYYRAYEFDSFDNRGINVRLYNKGRRAVTLPIERRYK